MRSPRRIGSLSHNVLDSGSHFIVVSVDCFATRLESPAAQNAAGLDLADCGVPTPLAVEPVDLVVQPLAAALGRIGGLVISWLTVAPPPLYVVRPTSARQGTYPIGYLAPAQVRWAPLVGAPRISPVNIGPTIQSEKIEDLLEILEFVRCSGVNRPSDLVGPSCGRLRNSLKASGNLSTSQGWWAQWWARVGLLGRRASRGAGELPLRREGWEHDPRRMRRHSTSRRPAPAAANGRRFPSIYVAP